MLSDYINVLVLFMIIGLGYFLTYKKTFTQISNQALTTLLLSVTLPLMLIINIKKDFMRQEFIKMLPDIGLPFLCIVSLALLSWLVTYLFKIDNKMKGVFINVCSMSSTIFFGIPVTIAIFGVNGLPYGLVYYIAQTVIYWTFGLVILKNDIAYIYPENVKQKITLTSIMSNIFSAPFIGFLVGTTLLLLQINIPSFIDQFLSYLANMTTPLAMLIIGSLLYFTDFKNLKLKKEVIIVLIFRFIVAPSAVLLLGYLLNTGSMMLKVTIIMSALPIPNTTVILVSKFKTDTLFATTVLAYSTILFLFYMPCLLWIMSNLA